MISIGVISKPHGIRGEVRLRPFDDCRQVFYAGASIFLQSGSINEEKEIVQVRPHGDILIVRLAGVEDRSGAELLRGAECLIDEALLPPRDDGGLYVFQLIGLSVSTAEGKYVGTITDVLEIPGQSVYVVDASGKEVLIPAVPEFVNEIDVEAGTVVVSTIEGLID